jgi:16S rRNA (adenine1518-N6/adenine1519-N6)-dimethyltransferase
MFQHKKRFGQNFLIDELIIDNIVAAINPQFEDNMLEIGVGTGAITLPLLAQLKRLNIVEIDNDLIKFWQAKNIPNLKINHSDILKFDLTQLGNNLRVVGNLPYNISSPILFKILDNIDIIQDMTFMLQSEVAQRITATPNNKIYGRLSVMLQAFFKTELLFSVPNTAFEPPPKVQSAIIRLTPLQNKITNKENFAFVVKSAFRMKRKTLRNNLKDIVPSSKIDLSLRAENLSVDDFIILTNEYLQQ